MYFTTRQCIFTGELNKKRNKIEKTNLIMLKKTTQKNNVTKQK